jgi:hypothetical protein
MLWNNVLRPPIVIQNTAYVTLPLGLVQFRGSNAAALALGAPLTASRHVDPIGTIGHASPVRYAREAHHLEAGACELFTRTKG